MPLREGNVMDVRHRSQPMACSTARGIATCGTIEHMTNVRAGGTMAMKSMEDGMSLDMRDLAVSESVIMEVIAAQAVYVVCMRAERSAGIEERLRECNSRVRSVVSTSRMMCESSANC